MSVGVKQKALELGERGFDLNNVRSKTVISRGRECQQHTFEKNKTSGTFERIMRGAGGAVATVATGGLVLAAEGVANLCGHDLGFIDYTFKSAYHGSVKEHIYEETGAAEVINEEVVGCNPKDTKSVKEFLNKNRHEWREANGHNFIVGKGRKGISFFYFIPDGDIDKAYSVKFWTAKNGKSVINTEKQLRAIRSYCAAFENIETEWEKEIPNLATRLVGMDTTNQRTLDQAKIAIRKLPRTLVIDARAGVARVYGPYDPNQVNPDSHRTGTAVKLSKETIEEINRAHGKSMEHKEPLAGERPFKTPPRDPLQDLLAQGGRPQGQGQNPLAPGQTSFTNVNIGSDSEEDMNEVD